MSERKTIERNLWRRLDDVEQNMLDVILSKRDQIELDRDRLQAEVERLTSENERWHKHFGVVTCDGKQTPEEAAELRDHVYQAQGTAYRLLKAEVERLTKERDELKELVKKRGPNAP